MKKTICILLLFSLIVISGCSLFNGKTDEFDKHIDKINNLTDKYNALQEKYNKKSELEFDDVNKQIANTQELIKIVDEGTELINQILDEATKAIELDHSDEATTYAEMLKKSIQTRLKSNQIGKKGLTELKAVLEKAKNGTLEDESIFDEGEKMIDKAASLEDQADEQYDKAQEYYDKNTR